MLCKKCGFENMDGSKFCVKCGNELIGDQIETIDFAKNNQVNESQFEENNQSNQINFSQTIHDKIQNFEIKHSIIATVVVSLVIIILNLIQTIIKTVRTTSYDYSTFFKKTEWDFDALKNLNFFDLVVKNYFYVVIAIVAVAKYII